MNRRRASLGALLKYYLREKPGLTVIPTMMNSTELKAIGAKQIDGKWLYRIQIGWQSYVFELLAGAVK